jgi:transposase-like protein
MGTTRVFHSKNEFVRGKSHVNGIEAIWSFANRRLAKFNGLNDENFIMHLQEYEFRYNNRDKDLVKMLTKMVNFLTLLARIDCFIIAVYNRCDVW